ncbi:MULTISPECIES: NAD(P)/FAD-dependent oxidoreductase [Gammaproteobacteria]|uniref:NAD(P)/FAD-dependent oxidoreductase n=1 Tax=Gammaproteobacteria TaxID=1236 RepID=UPI00186919F8|nr:MULTISPECIES: FAD-binding oxidoreductase [Gammaproteobacteria]
MDINTSSLFRQPQKKIIIIGAGIVGVMQAWYLAKMSNMQIILLDKADAGLGATKASFAWLNVSYGRPDAYQQLRSEAIHSWRILDKQTQGKLNIDWSGAISWMSSDEETAQFIQLHHQAGFNVQTLNKAQLIHKVPQLSQPPELAAFASDEGAVDPLHAINVLLQQAQEMGVKYYANTEVTRLLQDKHRIIGVETTKEKIQADHVILTAGVGSLALLAEKDIDLPLSASPSILLKLTSDAKNAFLPCIISTPEMELRPFAQNEIIAAEDYIDNSDEHHPEHIASHAQATFYDNFTQTGKLTIKKVIVGERPMPKDEMPIIGEVSPYQGLYLVTMHAAVTLSPLLCELVAQELIDEKANPRLTPYRLSRFS